MYISNKCVHYCCGFSKLLSPIPFISQLLQGLGCCGEFVCISFVFGYIIRLIWIYCAEIWVSYIKYIAWIPTSIIRRLDLQFKMWLDFCNMCGFAAFFHKGKRIFVLHNPVWIPKRIAVEKYNNIRRSKSITEKFLKMYIFLRLDFNRKSSPCWYGYLDI